MKKEKIKKLKEYFKGQDNILMAFIFGSQVEGRASKISDWDIGVYFKPKEYLELETERDYPNENEMRSDLIDILGTEEVDFVVLNRAKPSLVYNILREGLPLIIKNKKIYLDLLCKVSYEAMDWWKFVADFWKISEKAKSISPEAKTRLREHLKFLEREFGEIKEIRKFNWQDYLGNSFKRKIIERWVENLVRVSIDIAKIILASEKKEIPQSYKDTLEFFWAFYVGGDEKFGEKFASFAALRNIVTHQYLDLRWKQIKKFIREADRLYPKFIEKVKKIVK